MVELAVSIKLPPEIYEGLQQEAQHSQRSLEDVLIEDLSLLRGKPPANLTLHENFSDEKLWAVIHQQLDPAIDERLGQLVTQSKQALLTQKEQAELEYLLDIADDLVILRSQALVMLKARGHDVDSYLI